MRYRLLLTTALFAAFGMTNVSLAGPVILVNETFNGPAYAFRESTGDNSSLTSGRAFVTSDLGGFSYGVNSGSYYRIDQNLGAAVNSTGMVTIALDPTVTPLGPPTPLSFALAATTNFEQAHNDRIDVLLNGTLLERFFPVLSGNNRPLWSTATNALRVPTSATALATTFQVFTYDISSFFPPVGSASTLSLSFLFANSQGNENIGLDNVVITTTGPDPENIASAPEPGTMGLLAMGGMGLIGRAWRRRQSAQAVTR